jgi:hypothetical protein
MMGQEKRQSYQSINGSILVPRLNLTMEDLIISICPAMLGNGLSGLCSYISSMLGIFVGVAGISCSISLVIFAQKKRREEIKQRGFCRSSILRRYLTYLMGTDWLRCR